MAGIRVTEQNFDEMRRAMVVSQLRTTGVNDPRVVAAMGDVPRERFVPADKAPLAYADLPLPIGGQREINPPMVTGRLLTEAEVVPGEKVLVVGAGTGYTAELLRRLGAEVVALEQDADLLAIGERAAPGVAWVKGALTAGCREGAPYALIVIDGAVEEIPAAIVDQLAEGGRLVGALVDEGVTRLVSGVRVAGGFGTQAFADAFAARLPGFARPAAFSF
jgi:protein-L-isoaspartate(D-aspartate) O-methyltransferase